MKKGLKRIFDLNFIFYVILLIILLYVAVSFMGISGYTWTDIPLFGYIKSSANLIPFKTIRTSIVAVRNGRLNISSLIKNLLGKFLIFSQAGFFLPFFNKKLNKLRRFIFSAASLLFIIEVTQSITRRGRFDIDDFILNMAGALIGYGIWKNRKVQRFLKKLAKLFRFV